MKKILFAVFTLLTISVEAQNPVFDWARTFGNAHYELGFALDVDSAGSIYSTGWFYDSLDCDPNISGAELYTNGETDCFIMKHDASGNLIWAKGFGGPKNEGIYSIELDDEGNIYVCGAYDSIADFDPDTGVFNLTSNGHVSEIFVAKYSNSGSFIWAKSFGGNFISYAPRMILDSNKNIYINGSFRDTLDTDPGSGTFDLVNPSIYMDIFISKLDSSGNFQWAKQFGGTSQDFAQSFLTDKNGYVYLVGNFNGNIDFDPGPGVSMLNAVMGQTFFLKLSTAGVYQWVKQMKAITATKLAGDGNPNMYLAGFFSGTKDFDLSPGGVHLAHASQTDGFIASYDTSGAFRWMNQISGDSVQAAYSCDVDDMGNVYVTGAFDSIAYVDSAGAGIALHSNDRDIYIAQFDSLGHGLWGGSFGGPGPDIPYAIAVSGAANIYTTGYYSSAIDADPGPGISTLNFAGGYDIFLHKMRTCSASSYSYASSACYSYIFQGDTLFSSGIYIDTMLNAQGCDSIVTLNLTINNVDTAVVLNGTLLTASPGMISYQWINCSNMSAIPGATLSLFAPAGNGNYAVIVENNGCIDTSACINVVVVSATEIRGDNSVWIAPNPFSKKTLVTLSHEFDDVNIKVMDVSGRIIFTSDYKKTDRIELNPQLPEGIYFIELKSKEKLFFHGRIIQQ
jgi:hypothetical protein